jgi:hypothetical protein
MIPLGLRDGREYAPWRYRIDRDRWGVLWQPLDLTRPHHWLPWAVMRLTGRHVQLDEDAPVTSW